ncbi:hypothetical protein ACP70R_030112 [Stipagrostis hirtigluma subsp. patula]
MTASFGMWAWSTTVYAMSLNVGSLASNLYLSVVYNALVELPSSVMAWLIDAGRIKRWSSLMMLTAAVETLSLPCVAIPRGATALMACER